MIREKQMQRQPQILPPLLFVQGRQDDSAVGATGWQIISPMIAYRYLVEVVSGGASAFSIFIPKNIVQYSLVTEGSGT